MKDIFKGVIVVVVALALWDGIKYLWNFPVENIEGLFYSTVFNPDQLDH